jgi:hypothetical protein
MVKRHWWQHLLHTHRARSLANSLLLYGGSRLAVMIVPWYLEEPRIEEAVDPEETVSPQALEAADDESEGGRS